MSGHQLGGPPGPGQVGGGHARLQTLDRQRVHGVAGLRLAERGQGWIAPAVASAERVPLRLAVPDDQDLGAARWRLGLLWRRGRLDPAGGFAGQDLADTVMGLVIGPVAGFVIWLAVGHG